MNINNPCINGMRMGDIVRIKKHKIRSLKKNDDNKHVLEALPDTSRIFP